MDVTVQLEGYSFIEKLYEGSRTVVYRGLRDRDQHPVVVKFLKDKFPSFNELVQFSNQYNIAKNLNLPTVVKPLGLVSCGHASALVMEDFGGYDLKHFLKKLGAEAASQDSSLQDGSPQAVTCELNQATVPSQATDPRIKLGDRLPDLILFFQIAIQVTEALEGLSHHRIIHKDIKPTNILIHPQSRQVKLIDFSIASSLPREAQELQNVNNLEGTLAYLSPEQTGRMNRGIDYRSDFYAFGITCYELLTGQLPFTAEDPMEIVHGHLAKHPTPPHELCRDTLPAVVSDLVLKLMAKNAENRYQSAFGLRQDLEHCLHQLKETGDITPFKLGRQDVCDRFLLPEKLYGRQKEVAHLLAAFDRVSQGNTELMLIAGMSGIGKTALVNEIHKPITRQQGYFIQGKYDQLQRNVPLSGFIQAFRGLIRLLLSESDAQLEQWQKRILKAIGHNGQLIIDVIPELEGIIGAQPPVAEVPAAAAEGRFNLLMQKFVEVFTGPNHPLVIFLDDVQWADAVSFKLLQRLMKDDGHLLLIAAYRDNEVSAGHLLLTTLEEIRAARTSVATSSENIKSIPDAEHEIAGSRAEQLDIEQNEQHARAQLDETPEVRSQHTHVNVLALDSLSPKDVLSLVADTLRSGLDFARPLAELIYQKTEGNPFFAAQLLTALFDEGKITFDLAARHWQYDVANISATLLTDDVVELMGQRLQKLPAGTQSTLKLAACIGAEFDLATLVIAAQKPISSVTNHLWCALQEGLVIPTSDSYKAFTPQDTTVLQNVNPSYRFFHDRVQQAAYALIEPQQQATTHLAIGRQLLAHTPPSEQEKQLFNIVNHLNQGTVFIKDAAELTRLRQLNFRAGQKSKAAGAYAAALEYFLMAVDLLPRDRWQTAYEFTLSLYEEIAETAYLKGDLSVMQTHIDSIFQQSRTLLDQIHAYEIRIQAAISQNYFLQAVEITLQLLEQLGVIIPNQPEPDVIQKTLAETAEAIGRQPTSELLALPEMSDPEALVVIRLITKAASAALVTNLDLMVLLVCAGIQRSLVFGNSPLSSFVYSLYGLLLCGTTGNVVQGNQMGKLSLDLLEKIPAKESKTRAIATVYCSVYPWMSHIKESLSPLANNYQDGLDNGDNEYAVWSLYSYCYHAYISGYNLEKLAVKLSRNHDRASQLQQESITSYLALYQQIIDNLIGNSSEPTQIEGNAYSEITQLPVQLSTNDITGLALLYINKGVLGCLFSRSHRALESFDKARNYLSGITSSQMLPLFYFYDSLACLACPEGNLMARVDKNQEKIKAWAKLAPMNHLHRWHLVEAERDRQTGNKSAAIDHYDNAIMLAQTHGFVQEEALANELAAQFYLMWGKGRVAQGHMTDAYYGYSRWGAKAKIADLERRYPKLLAAILQQQQQSLSSTDTILAYANTTTTSSSSGISEVIDLTTLLHTSQILSSEIKLDKLLSALLEAVIQNAGADKCALLMPKVQGETKEWVIEAFSELGKPHVLLESQALKLGEHLPVALINQVKHTCEPMVIFNAAVHSALTVDPYVLRHQPKSVLCAPILNQGKLIAILYLENNLTIGAFTANRVEVLNLICTQAAISLENARLYHQAQKALEELQTSHMQLVQSEKMSALGSLVAGVAHEINNPVNFLKGNLKPALNYVQDLLSILDLVEADEPREAILAEMEDLNLEFIREDLPNLLHSMTFGISRIRDISTSLRTFSRSDKEYKTAFNLHEGLDSTLLILKHRLSSGDSRPSIEVFKDYGTLPKIDCFAGQLNQVFMNLIANAIDALEEINELRSLTEIAENPSQITITTALTEEKTVTISIADNGPGMDEAVQSRVFDHLFTTKPVGKGTGLGLAISYSIVVEKHSGTLTVNSTPGQGTEFLITLPL